jgi:hypothetical protein
VLYKLFFHLTLHFIESSKPNPNQISTSNGKPGAVNGAVGTTFQPQNPLLGRACESCYGKFAAVSCIFHFEACPLLRLGTGPEPWGGLQTPHGKCVINMAQRHRSISSEWIDAHPCFLLARSGWGSGGRHWVSSGLCVRWVFDGSVYSTVCRVCISFAQTMVPW